MKTPPSTCTRAVKSSPPAALYQRQRLSTFTAACHVWSMSTEEVAPFCCVSQASELGSHNNGRRAHHCRSLFSTGLMAERQSANRNLSACLDEENSNNTQDTQGFLTKLLNRQKTRLDERSSQLSNMTLSQTLHKSLRGSDVHWQNEGNHFDQMTSVLTQLGEADMAAGSIETLLGDLKDSLAKIPGAGNISTLDVMNISKQRDSLWKELETLKNTRRILEHLLEKQNSKYNRSMNGTSVEVLMERLIEDEAENRKLRSQVIEKEAKTKDVSQLIQEEKLNAVKSSQLSKSMEATHSRLQSLVKKKEAENEQMVTRLQNIETAISCRKLEVEDVRNQMSSLKAKRAFEKVGLKKAARAQKQKVLRFQAAVEKRNLQMKEKEIQLSEALSCGHVWRSHHDSAVENKTHLEVQNETLTKQLSDHLKNNKKIEDESEHSKEALAEKLRLVNLENAHFSQENTKLKASIAALETQTVPVNSELSELQEKAKQQRDFVEHYENQVQKLQLEAKELKQRFEAVFTDNKQIIENKDLENEKVRSQMETHLNQLEHVPGLLITADQMLQECQESLLVCKRKCVSRSETVTELQIQADVSDYFLGNQCLEMENNRIKKKCEETSTKLEKMISQNQLFEEKLKNQERDLQQSETQLEDKSRECRTVLRLLENAVEEGRKQISEEKEKVLSSELALQRKLQGLESELKKKKAEQRQLESTFNSFEKNNDLRLEELKHSLEKTEHKNQSIQNYVQFLKTSYSAMFG
ncbi:protein BCAP isoform X2 [Ascaphus truei]|uniref:protein BCAP isoform X2 n=1 Tax=Ascaphus truei TaxID=8439 RepID=UPI003F597A35